MPHLLIVAAAADVALVAQGALTGAVAIVVVLTALWIAFRSAPMAMVLTSGGIAVLLAAGLVAASQIPVAAQVATVSMAAKNWTANRVQAANCVYDALPLTEQGIATPQAADPACPEIKAPNGYIATPGAW